MITAQNIETLAAAILFAAIFFFSGKLRLPPRIRRHHRRVLSFASGISIAYVFVYLLPELATAKEVFLRTTEYLPLPFPELRVYLSAMIGFMFFYGLEHMVTYSRLTAGRKSLVEKTGGPIFVLHIGGFAAYAWLISYLMVDSIEEKPLPTALYAVAMGLHFFSIDHALRSEHASLYEKFGKNILAFAALAGWVVGIFTDISKPMVITLLGVITGAVIMNSMIMELPKEKEGKFLPFLLGGIFYTGLLILIG